MLVKAAEAITRYSLCHITNASIIAGTFLAEMTEAADIATGPKVLGLCLNTISTTVNPYFWLWRGPGGGLNTGVKVRSENASAGALLHPLSGTAGAVDDAGVDEGVIAGLQTLTTTTTISAVEVYATTILTCNLGEVDAQPLTRGCAGLGTSIFLREYMSQEMIHIEGLDEFTDHDLTANADTPPDAIIVWFDAVKEYMPALSEEKGERVYKTFIHRFYIKELGFSSGNRRIKDHVEYDNEAGKWKVRKLAAPGQSDIKKWPNEWNKFAKGNTGVIEGTPIELIFKHDPARAEIFKRNMVDTIERLAALTDGDCQRGGMGWIDDRTRARTFLAKSKEQAGDIRNNARFVQLEDALIQAEKRNKDLEEKLNILLTAQIEAAQEKLNPVKKSVAPKRSRPKHPQAIISEQREGVE